MKSIKVKPGESFKLIITNDDGIEMGEVKLTLKK